MFWMFASDWNALDIWMRDGRMHVSGVSTEVMWCNYSERVDNISFY